VVLLSVDKGYRVLTPEELVFGATKKKPEQGVNLKDLIAGKTRVCPRCGDKRMTAYRKTHTHEKKSFNRLKMTLNEFWECPVCKLTDSISKVIYESPVPYWAKKKYGVK